MVYLQKCCCCVSLKTGGIVLGILSIIGALITISLSGISIIGLDLMGDIIQNTTTSTNSSTPQNSSSSTEISDEDRVLAQFVLKLVQIYMGLAAIFAIITLVCSILLIYGALKVRMLRK